MNDLEICKRIAEIEGLSDTDFTYYERVVNGAGICINYKKYNPLTDDGLCKRLVVKHKVSLSVSYKIWRARMKTASCAPAVHDESYSRAAMLCIIEAHKDV